MSIGQMQAYIDFLKEHGCTDEDNMCYYDKQCGSYIAMDMRLMITEPDVVYNPDTHAYDLNPERVQKVGNMTFIGFPPLQQV